jgi:hypothetical protein
MNKEDFDIVFSIIYYNLEYYTIDLDTNNIYYVKKSKNETEETFFDLTVFAHKVQKIKKDFFYCTRFLQKETQDFFVKKININKKEFIKFIENKNIEKQEVNNILKKFNENDFYKIVADPQIPFYFTLF